MSGEQLERSILEHKEREELKAIAAAMSLEPVARTKKADLVDQILRAAGVEVAPAGEQAAPNGKATRPRTTRSRSTKAAKAPDDAAAAQSEPAARGGEAVADAAPGPSAKTPAKRFSYSASPVDDTSSNGHSFVARARRGVRLRGEPRRQRGRHRRAGPAR